jgi:tRNA-Thr(GGU) m(6)t(6)A37 methyltransferase TsaA
MTPIIYTPLGVIHSPFTDTAGMPLQAVAARGVAGTIELDPRYEAGLTDLAAFSHLILLYHFHRVRATGALLVTPFLDTQRHGVFATRSPQRPNTIGLSIVRLVAIAGCTLSIEDIDVVDGTPLLDIKPFVPAFDVRTTDQVGWFAPHLGRLDDVRADSRFD